MHSVCIIKYDVEEPERQIEITPTPNLMLSKITHYNITYNMNSMTVVVQARTLNFMKNILTFWQQITKFNTHNHLFYIHTTIAG